MKGWTSNIHSLEWLRRVFEPQTRTRANGQPRLLICDGHDSHISGNFVSYCMQNNIYLLILPPYTSHATQPLDVALFGPLSRYLATMLAQYNEAQATKIYNYEWVIGYAKARQQAFRLSNIQSAWRGAGLLPFNPLKVIRESAPTPIQQRATTPDTQFEIFNTSFENSSPVLEHIEEANQLLSNVLDSQNILNTPTTRYIKRLATTTAKKQHQLLIKQREIDNLR